jgi:sugar phosphate isomerase/epimerase
VGTVEFSVFTKPWKMPLGPLAEHVQRLGFAGIELPVRPGFQVEPAAVTRDLPKAARQLRERGLKIFSVAGPTDEPTIATCAELGIPIIRIMVPVDAAGYVATETRVRRELDALIPLLDRYGVAVGIQNHYGRMISNAAGLRALLAGYNPQQVAAIWDAAHEGLEGIEPELALDLIWPHLAMVNLKNAFWLRTNGPEAEIAVWQPYWTSGRQGRASWPRVVAELQRRSYTGVVCLTAEYSDEAATNRLIAEDIAYAKGLFGEGPDLTP